MSPLMQTPPGAKTTIDGKEYLYFSGTGYLGLHGDPRVIDAAIRATEQFGLGSGTARSGYGTMPPVAEVERQAATFFGTEDAFYFPSGYLGSSLLIRALAGTFDLILHDEAVHYSSRDAATLAKKPIVTFRTRDSVHLEEVLRTRVPPAARPLVLVDGVFPVRGAISPIEQYIELLSLYPDAALVVDDAHGSGVLGEHGRGSYEHAGIEMSQVNTGRPSRQGPNQEGPHLFACGTMSKAFGGYGGIVFGSREFITHTKEKTAYLSAMSALPPGVAAAAAESLRILGDEPGILERLRANVAQARAGLKRLGLPIEEAPTPTICLELGTAAEMRQIQEALAQEGVLIGYQPSYSDLGPEGALRIAVCAAHTPAMIEMLLYVFKKNLAGKSPIYHRKRA